MKKIALLATFIVPALIGFAQKKTTTSATVSFDATTPLDPVVKADNKTVIAALNTQTGDVQFEATVKNFAFANPRVQDHFNGKNWLNSDEHPTFTFKGKITEPKKVNFGKSGTYNVNVKGNLKVKTTEKEITVPVTIVVDGGVVKTTSDFTITLADFGVTGTSIDSGKVAKQPKITVAADFK